MQPLARAHDVGDMLNHHISEFTYYIINLKDFE